MLWLSPLRWSHLGGSREGMTSGMRISTPEHLRVIWWLFQETVESRSQAGTLEFRKWIKGQLHCRWELCSGWCGVGSALCLSLPPSVHSLDSACYVPDCSWIPWLLCPPCLGGSFWSWIGRGDLKLGILSPSFLSHVCEHEIPGGLSTSFLKTFCHVLLFSLPTLTQTALDFPVQFPWWQSPYVGPRR